MPTPHPIAGPFITSARVNGRIGLGLAAGRSHGLNPVRRRGPFIPPTVGGPEVIFVGFDESDQLNPTLTAPAEIQAGDWMFIAVASVVGTNTVTSPSFTAYDSGAWGGVWWNMFTRVADGSETTISLSTSGADSSHRTATILAVFRGSYDSTSSETEGGSSASVAVPTVSGFEVGDMAVTVTVSAYGVVSGLAQYPASPYLEGVDSDSALGKFSCDLAYWPADQAGSNPAGDWGFTGDKAQSNTRTIRLVPNTT